MKHLPEFYREPKVIHPALLPERDIILLDQIAAEKLSEADAYREIIRLIFVAADLRRRLEGRNK